TAITEIAQLESWNPGEWAKAIRQTVGRPPIKDLLFPGGADSLVVNRAIATGLIRNNVKSHTLRGVFTALGTDGAEGDVGIPYFSTLAVDDAVSINGVSYRNDLLPLIPPALYDVQHAEYALHAQVRQHFAAGTFATLVDGSVAPVCDLLPAILRVI